MKYLMLFLPIFLTGCLGERNISRVDTRDLKFKAGQEVTILSGFYSVCTGTITGYVEYFENRIYRYTISANCPNVVLGIIESENNLKAK